VLHNLTTNIIQVGVCFLHQKTDNWSRLKICLVRFYLLSLMHTDSRIYRMFENILFEGRWPWPSNVFCSRSIFGLDMSELKRKKLVLMWLVF